MNNHWRRSSKTQKGILSNLEPDEFGNLLPTTSESANPEEKWRYESPGSATVVTGAQTVVKMMLEPILEPVFDADSYGYRPGSALDAIAVNIALLAAGLLSSTSKDS